MQTALYQQMAISPVKPDNTGKSLGESIIKALAYFDIFQYPLSKIELKQFLDQPVIEAAFDKTLERLVNKKTIFRLYDFYSLHNNLLLAQKRKQGNIRAEQLLSKAMKIGRFLYKFPYVRAIGISGSLSKNYADQKADIDFFIITKANRLWIARTLMHIFKKLTFLTGRQHLYCMNYYVDESALEVENKNIYTAIEVTTLLPVYGKEKLHDFFAANDWVNELLPACSLRLQQMEDPPGSWFQKLVEWMFNNRIGDQLDTYLMKITSLRWKRKTEKGKCNEKGQVMGLITGKHFAWSNPESFQEKVLSLYTQKLAELKLQDA